MRIGILYQYSLLGSGSGIYVTRLAQGLCALGHNVGILCWEPEPERHSFVEAAYRGRGSRVQTLFQRRPSPRCWLHLLEGQAPVAYPRAEAPERPLFTQLSDEEIEAYVADLADQVTDVVLRHRLEILHANHVILMPYVAWLVKEQTGIPYVVTVHGSTIEYVVVPDPRYRPYAERGLRKADRVIVLNEDVRERTLALCPQARIVEVPVGVDTRLFRPA